MERGNMRFRWKLLILLLLIAMVPMVTMRFFGSRSIRQLGDTLIAQSRESMVAHTEDRLRLVTDGYASVIWRAREKVEIALDSQAAAVERALAADPAAAGAVYFSNDFIVGDAAIPGLMPSPENTFYRHGGKSVPLEITYEHPVFHLAPDISAAAVASDLRRLSHLSTDYRRVNKHLRGEVSWHYTSLSNGLHSAYPGHGGIPCGMDPRNQHWYRQATEKSARLWTDAYVDPETRQIVIAAVAPVHRTGGEWAGVTAIVVPLSNFLQRRMLVQNIPPDTHSFLGFLEKHPGTGETGIRIFSQEAYSEREGRSWRDQLDETWLTSDSKTDMRAVIRDLEMGAGNSRRMPYDGCDCLWVYGPIHQNGFLILTTPYAEILAPAQRLEARIQGLIDRMLLITRYWVLGSAVLVMLLALAFSRTVTRPMQALAEGARRLGEGDLGARVRIQSRDEFGEMGRVFNSIVPKLLAFSKIQQSLQLAMEVQQNLMPKKIPSLPGLDIAAQVHYCDETGGDYYDFLTFSENDREKFGLVVGDVSDHGISSALMMATVRALLRQRAAMPGGLGEIVSDVNRQVFSDVEESGQFVTMFVGAIDVSAGLFEWVRAGHDPALLYDRHTDEFNELKGDGVALGISADFDFQENRLLLSAGNIIVIGTDGIWEAHDAEGRFFGKRAVREIIRTHRDASAREIVDAVINALNVFRHPVGKEDDVTLMIIKAA